MLTVSIDKKNLKYKFAWAKIFNDNASTRNYWQKAHWESIKINIARHLLLFLLRRNRRYVFK